MPIEPESKTATILVVDDNESNRLLARSTLEDEGYRVVVAAGGAEGIAVFEREEPACVLLDVRMPEIDGFVACERIRALPSGRDTPIIFLTALRDVDTFDHALRAGGDDFLTKPVRPTELVVRVQTALKLRQMRTELQEHYELLRHQRDDLMRLQLQKERLMAFVVHDLKNPVNSMDLHAQILLRDKELSSEVRASVSHIRVAARQLTGMIVNLLDLSKADEGRLSPNRVDIDPARLLSEVLNELEVTAQARKVTLQSAVTVQRIRADEDLFRRLLTNLIENAIRYAPEQSPVVVTIADIGKWTELRVADAGGGVALEMRERIFDPFVQVEEGYRVVAHTSRGLGLSFCKMVAEAHSGRIWVEDAAPGSAFCVRLPADA